MTTPAAAGPMKRAVLKTTELMATAVERCSLSTRLETTASLEGWLKPITTPFRNVRPTTSQILAAPLQTSTAITMAWIMAMDWASMMMRIRSNLSASTPPIGPMMMDGARSAKATAPSQKPDSVRFQVSQPTAIRCIHKPMSDTELPATYRP